MKKRFAISRKRCESDKENCLEIKGAPHIGCDSVLLRSMLRGVLGPTSSSLLRKGRRGPGDGPGSAGPASPWGHWNMCAGARGGLS